ncbi:MAG: stage II sporulation protein R [Eubacteriales bacterium]
MFRMIKKLCLRHHAKASCFLQPLLCICLSVLCAASVIGALPTKGEEMLYDRVIRLHVLANSDSEADQALKLRVRDAVLAYLEDTSVSADNADEAETEYRALLPEIEAAAVSVIAASGYDYPCRVTLTREAYPQRNYETVTLPAGTYRSLRVQIGDAAGRNWWCILFPPLCLSLAADMQQYDDSSVPAAVYEDTDSRYASEEEALLAAGFTPYEISLISGEPEVKTVVKFRIIEFFRSLFAK